MEEEARHGLGHGQGTGELGVEARSEEKEERRGHDRPVERVTPQPADPVEVLGRVVDGVEPPQERDLV